MKKTNSKLLIIYILCNNIFTKDVSKEIHQSKNNNKEKKTIYDKLKKPLKKNENNNPMNQHHYNNPQQYNQNNNNPNGNNPNNNNNLPQNRTPNNNQSGYNNPMNQHQYNNQTQYNQKQYNPNGNNNLPQNKKTHNNPPGDKKVIKLKNPNKKNNVIKNLQTEKSNYINIIKYFVGFTLIVIFVKFIYNVFHVVQFNIPQPKKEIGLHGLANQPKIKIFEKSSDLKFADDLISSEVFEKFFFNNYFYEKIENGSTKKVPIDNEKDTFLQYLKNNYNNVTNNQYKGLTQFDNNFSYKIELKNELKNILISFTFNDYNGTIKSNSYFIMFHEKNLNIYFNIKIFINTKKNTFEIDMNYKYDNETIFLNATKDNKILNNLSKDDVTNIFLPLQNKIKKKVQRYLQKKFNKTYEYKYYDIKKYDNIQ